MKKTLVALAVTALAASASATTIYDAEGTKVDVYGNIRLLLENVKIESKGAETAHSKLRNDGTRIGVDVKHNISDDFYALGRLEFRPDQNHDSTGFGSFQAKRAYIGLGSKSFGEVRFGRQLTIGDEVKRVGFDNTYGASSTVMEDFGKSVVRYDYTRDGLKVGVGYRFAEDRDAHDEVIVDKLKGGIDAGVIYEFDIADGQSASVAAGYSRNNYKTAGAYKHHEDSAIVGASYTVNGLTLAADYGFQKDVENQSKDRTHFAQFGAKYRVTDTAAVYGNYAYITGETKAGSVKTDKERVHKYMLGAEYKLHKHVLTFVEGRIVRRTEHDLATGGKTRTTDRAVGVGLRIFW